LYPALEGASSGREADPATVVDACEELAYTNRSAGWAFARNTTVMGYNEFVKESLGQEPSPF